MRCRRPIDISIKTGSRESLSVRGRRRVVYTRSSFLVPCGKCLACKSRHKSQMVFRMDCEKRHGHLLPDGSVRKYRHCFFVTLSYADRLLPKEVDLIVDSKTGECFNTVYDESGLLCRRHLSEFMKRLRRYYHLDCKVFACGEYGDERNRPHFHLIFYSDLNWQQTVNAVRHAWSFKCPVELRNTPGSFCVGDGLYRTWRFGYGRVDVKSVNYRRIRYVAKYVVKDSSKDKAVPCFASVSNGLGSAWLLSSEARAVRSNKRLFAYVGDSRPASIGRYFSHRIFTRDELDECVDAYIRDFESPPDGSEFGEPYRRWYREHVEMNNVLYRQSLANVVIPRLSHF